jgi:hypothetical protein
MTKGPVIYRLESQCAEGALWLPILDEHRQPITFTGRASKPRALTMAALVLRWPSYWGVRVMKSDTPNPVWEWTRRAE